MKKCPTCDKEFEDSMRFCQVDGTVLVDDAPAFDPYATIVGAPVEPKSAVEEAPQADVPEPGIREESEPIAPPADVLDLPEADALKTMYVSDAEMQAVLEGTKKVSEPEIIELEPVEESPSRADDISDSANKAEAASEPAPAPPSFDVPDVPSPSFQDFGPPPSPFSPLHEKGEEAVPAPSDFDDPKPDPFAFNEAETMIQPSFGSPFDPPQPPPPVVEWTPPPAPASVSSPFDPPPSAPVAEWTPPPAPDSSWQNKEIGANTPFQPPAAGSKKLNQTLPIVSLVLGILSVCCYISPVTGFIAVVVGFLGLKNIQNDPNQYGGRTLAIIGMILGGLFLIIGLAYYVFILFFGGMAMILEAVN